LADYLVVELHDEPPNPAASAKHLHNGLLVADAAFAARKDGQEHLFLLV